MNLRCFQRNFSAAFPPLVPLQLPSPMETHLWYTLPDEVKSSALLNHYSELLFPCERDSVNSMRGDQLKKRALLARALVRTTIARSRSDKFKQIPDCWNLGRTCTGSLK